MSPKNKDGPSSGPEEIHLDGIVRPGPLPSNIDPDMNYVGLSSGWKSVMELTEDDEREDPNKVILVKLGSELLEQLYERDKMYKAVIPITIDITSDSFEEAVRLAKQMAEVLLVLPSVTRCGDIIIYDQQGRQLYPEPERNTEDCV